jgi:hypothetical protein
MDPRRRTPGLLTALCTLALLLLPAAAPASGQNFSAHVDNPWFPLKPGTTYVYVGSKDGKAARDVYAVTHRTTLIDGARCVAIRDRLYLRGRLAERTTDYYTQDQHGAVWYYGEDTAELDVHGHVTSTEGTWRTGVNGARPGIYMPAHPQVGERHRQEFYRGHAEDHFQVVSRNARITVPYGTFTHALRTKEWTPLEPGVLDAKYYARGIGQVAERTVRGGSERALLVKIIRRT